MIPLPFRGENMNVRKKAAGLAVAVLSLLAPSVPGLAGSEDAKEPRIQISFAERFRVESWDNAVNLDETSDEGFGYTRNKTTLGLKWRALEGLEISGKVTNEFRVYFMPKDRPFNWHEVFFDNLAVHWRLPVRIPLTVTAGRQDIFLGEGFVLADGTPLDGSRSFYFNALRVDYDPSPGHKLLAFYHVMNETDTFLPVLNDRKQALVEQPEKALALYYAGALSKVKLDAYGIWKKTERSGEENPGSSFTTMGARLQIPVVSPLNLTLEGACQSGSFGDAGRRAFGGISHLDFTPPWEIPFLKTLVFGGIFLSGDDPGTERLEAWDPLFSRWPKWSDGYLLTFTRESRPAYWSNLSALYGSILLDLGGRADAVLNFYRLGANEPRPGVFPGGPGLSRGFLMVHRLNFVVSAHLTGYLLWENFQPGDFYFPGADGFNWLRFELHFRY
jgi:hypothetical protein